MEPNSPSSTIKTLVLTDFVDSTRLNRVLGDARWVDVTRRADDISRELLRKWRGVEVNRSDGYLLAFDSTANAVRYALDYHDALAELSRAADVRLEVRAGIHRDEVIVTSQLGVEGASAPFLLQGLAVPATARLMSIGGGGQTLLSRAAFEDARAQYAEAIAGTSAPIVWMAHGRYRFKGLNEYFEVFEAGFEGRAPLSAPGSSEKAQRADEVGSPELLGWRPGPGMKVASRPTWIIRRKLGEGGFGEVWLAEHAKLGTPRVLKFCFDAERLRGLKREVTIYRALQQALANNDHVAKVLDWNLDEPPYFVELEYADGGSLVDYGRAIGGVASLSLKERLDMIAPIAEALADTHRAGILHRDVKPSNILVGKDRLGKPKLILTDFGLGAMEEQLLLQKRAITQTGMTGTAMAPSSWGAGTRIYIAPEILEGGPPSVQSDIYSFGVMLYQLVLGDFTRVLGHGWEDDVPRRDLAAIIGMCVRSRPSSRAREMATVVRALRAWNPEAPDMAPAGFRRPAGWHWGRIGVVAACLLLPPAAFLGYLWNNSGSRKNVPPQTASTAPALPAPASTPTPTPAPQPTAAPAPTPAPVAHARVLLSPNPPVRGEFLTILFDATGTVLEGQQEVFMHHGRNGWKNPAYPRPKMARYEPNRYRHTMRVALDTEVLNFCFSNHFGNEGAWENNGGKDWNVPTVRSSTISQTEAELQVAARRPIANILQLPDNEPIRMVGRLTSFSEVLHMNFPSFLTFVGDAGDQITVTYWEPTARERQSLQTALEVGAAYEVVGRKISYRGIPQVALEGGANLRQTEARVHNWSWSPPKVPIGKLTARSGGQIVRTSFILQKDVGFWDPQASAGQVAATLATDPANGKTLDTRIGCPIGAYDLNTWLRAGMEGGRLVEALALVRVGSKGNVELLILRPEDIVSASR